MAERQAKRLRGLIDFLVSHDFDLYLLLGFALLLVAVELLNGKWTTALFAATLGAFARSLVRLRHDVGRMSDEKSGLSSVFLDATPGDVLLSFARASELLLIGVSLDRTLRDAYTPLEEFLGRGGRLRALLVNPRSEWAVRIADRRAYHEQTVERRREHIESSIATFKHLKERTGGDLEVRLTEDPLTYGATMIDGDANTRETRIVVQHYSYKKRKAREPNPVFVVRPADGEWFTEFREELENLWNDGTPTR